MLDRDEGVLAVQGFVGHHRALLAVADGGEALGLDTLLDEIADTGLRAFLGEEAQPCAGGSPNGMVSELKANIDDMTGEEIAYACSKLRAAGALDVSLVQALMKKGRPGQTLVVLCAPEKADAMAAAILRETSTFGVRRADMARYELRRSIAAGADGVRVKRGHGFGVEKSKREFDDSHPPAGAPASP